jgi:hypothetical protein
MPDFTIPKRFMIPRCDGRIIEAAHEPVAPEDCCLGSGSSLLVRAGDAEIHGSSSRVNCTPRRLSLQVEHCWQPQTACASGRGMGGPAERIRVDVTVSEDYGQRLRSGAVYPPAV